MATSLLGGVAVGPTAEPVPSGVLVVGVAWQRWGLVVDAGLQGPRSVRVDPAKITASLQWVTLSAQVTFSLGRLTLDLSVGLRGTRVDASATGVSAPTPAALLALGAGAAVGARLRLIGPLHAELRLLGGARALTEHLGVGGVATTLNLLPLELQGVAGLGGVFDLSVD